MHIMSILERLEPPLNAEQRAILEHDEGPLLVIAGPGSGKTRCLLLRALNLLLLGKTLPSELVLCTFTEKAANEMRTRFLDLARQVGYGGDLSQLRVGTIHGICNRLLQEHRYLLEIATDYMQHDAFTQRLFIFQHLHAITRGGTLQELTRKSTPWEIAKELQAYFDKIMEELIQVREWRNHTQPLLRQLALAYDIYCTLLMRENCISFSALLKFAHKLLQHEEAIPAIISGIKYVFVDEYQDTNYIQEQILLKLSSGTGNLCVVGDEDQALYRFRGATVRNILEFESTVPNCTTLHLSTNYRSHATIVERYDRWMATHDWHNTDDKPAFRTPKHIQPPADLPHRDYPAAISIHGTTPEDEARQCCDLITFLKEQQLISDYSQVALLLHSIQHKFSHAYVAQMAIRNIPCFCPRSRAFFEQDEIKLLTACIAILLDYKKNEGYEGEADEWFFSYLSLCMRKFHEFVAKGLAPQLQHLIDMLTSKLLEPVHAEEALSAKSLLDYFYHLLAVEPFATFLQDERKMRNLVIFSEHLQTFQHHFHYTALNCETREILCHDFFSLFLRHLVNSGVNEYEDHEQAIVPGHIHLMTIHQAKGLEFSVVIVGSLQQNRLGDQHIDRDLDQFYRRPRFEPEQRIPGFDMMRLYYVAFSRAQHLLVLTSNGKHRPRSEFHPMFEGLPAWPYIQSDLLQMPPTSMKEPQQTKRAYNLTQHIQMYETCPRQYQYYREYRFVPSRQKEVFLGLLVHQTIEEIHHIALRTQRFSFTEETIRALLERIASGLASTHHIPSDSLTLERACTQVYNYVSQNRDALEHLLAAEVNVSLEKEHYILTGRIDMLTEHDNKIDIIDFKTMPRPHKELDTLVHYERQLCTYAAAIEARYKREPGRLLLYWTGEARREDALMEFRYQPELVTQVHCTIDSVVARIARKDFDIVTPPEHHVCVRCDMLHLCLKQGQVSI